MVLWPLCHADSPRKVFPEPVCPRVDMVLCSHLALTAPFVLLAFWPEDQTLISSSQLSVVGPRCVCAAPPLS